MKLRDKVALVTGAGSGLGQEIAVAMAREGARIIVNDIKDENIKATVERIRESDVPYLGVKCDVSSSEEVAQMFAGILDKFGTLDILVNNAGITVNDEKVNQNYRKLAGQLLTNGVARVSLEATRNMTDCDWDKMVKVHLYGTFYCTREALKIMEDKGSGKIINMASVSGITGTAGAPAYSAAKGGIIAFTKAVAAEVIRVGVYVNAIAPGYIDTPFLDDMSPESKSSVLLATPIGRLGKAAEIAPLVVFLASDDSSYIVGQVFSPNGGLVL
jgi:NAD(P)-dependent dehydrogenase (short-subunit alcohol dehydrogenase family)